MKAYEIRKVNHRGNNGTRHIAYIGGINKVIDYVTSCCGGKIMYGYYGKNHSVTKYKRIKTENGLTDCIPAPLTKKQIKETILNNKVSSFSGNVCGGYILDSYDVIEITIE